ncbi:DUF2975 domain-containing protein [Sphingomonas sp. QA11]|uniref:DUF2975 domain-containing protein n=1 Tax=Sphingomonas sp. QA11 TaxID=2950605 RepID=UPI00234AEBEB|nr:DUF2975 domain-containing protein [Sphingomonas sp. QA11]WCM25400.1 DUF2975 domain-containing protein [Sphingomonas sp. QA11]
MSRMSNGNDPASDGLTPSMKLARRGRIFFAIACACMMVMAAAATVQILLLLLRDGQYAGLLNGGFAFVLPGDDASNLPSDFVPISHFAVWQSVLAAGLLTLRLVPSLVILASLIGLFRLYARQLVFTARNEAHLHRIAWALIGYAVVPLVTHAALYVAGMSAVAIKLELRQLDAAVLGILLFAFVHVVAFGSEIDRDRAGFV